MTTRIAVVQDGIIINVIMAEPGDLAPEGAALVELPAGSTAGPGWLYDGEAFTDPRPVDD